MSVEQFSKLSLGEDMVTTRAGAIKASRTASGSSSNSNQDRPLQSVESPSHTSPTPALVISTNNLKYNVSTFDDDLRRRVRQGLEATEIKMKYCAFATDEDADGAKHFYVNDDISIAIGGNLPTPRCTCGANEKGLACKHIYWLVDQILSTAPEDIDEEVLQFSPDGSTVQSTTPVEILDSKGLQSVAVDRNWIVKKEDLPEDEDDIKDDITNMLSVFEPKDALPGEFKVPESPLACERSRKYQAFTKMFCEYAARDPGLFMQMRDIIDSPFQRRVFFEKIDSRIARTFHALDEYITHGPMNASPDALRFDVPNCANQLRLLVNAISEFCSEQDEEDPDTRDVLTRAASALINILDRVVDRNVDAYEDIAWGLEAPSDPVESNLFVALIGSHVAGDPSFVLHTLRSLPQEDVLRNHWETLQNIEQKLTQNNTPSGYVNDFRRVVHDSRKRAASEVREGESNKRAMQE